MPASDLETYGSWNLDLPLFPERSRLYYLEPIAIGTAHVEGLISYVCRLAEAHCVSPGILTKQEILPSLRKIYTVGPKEIHEVRGDGNVVSISSSSKPANNRNPNEQGFWAWQYIEGLQPLTLWRNLQALTIPRWAEQIAQVDQKIKIARDLRAWCPECFQQWRNINQIIYEPLLWSIAAVTVCPYHRQPLQSRCPHCKKTQRPITGKMQIARCSQCLNWLDIRSDGDLEAEYQIKTEIEWHLWVVESVMEVLVVTPKTLTLETRERVACVLRENQESLKTDSVSCPIKRAQWQFLKAFVH